MVSHSPHRSEEHPSDAHLIDGETEALPKVMPLAKRAGLAPRLCDTPPPPHIWPLVSSAGTFLDYDCALPLLSLTPHCRAPSSSLLPPCHLCGLYAVSSIQSPAHLTFPPATSQGWVSSGLQTCFSHHDLLPSLQHVRYRPCPPTYVHARTHTQIHTRGSCVETSIPCCRLLPCQPSP